MSLITANNLIHEFGLSIGIDALSLDSSGVCQLLFDRQWLVTIMHSAGLLLLNCPIASADIVGCLPRNILLEILQENFKTGASGVVVVAPDERAYLQILLPLGMVDGKSLQTAVERLLNRSEAWSARFTGLQLKSAYQELSIYSETHKGVGVGSNFGFKTKQRV